MNQTMDDIIKDYRRLLDQIDARLRDAGHKGVTAQQALLLSRIGDRTLSMGELLGDAWFGRSAIYSVNKLVKKKLMASGKDEGDGRRRLVWRTRAAEPITRVVEEVSHGVRRS